MAEFWADLDPGVKWTFGIVGTALLAGAVGLMYQRIGKILDRRADRALAEATARTSAPPSEHSKAGERYLLRIARGPERRQGPKRWRFTYNLDFGQYQLENMASDIAHDVKIDVFTSGRKPELVSAQTIRLSRLPPEIPAMLPLGSPSRAKDFIVCVRWDDLYGSDQLERLRAATALRE